MYKDSEQVSSGLVRSGSAPESDLYTLTIGGLEEADYGNYSCVAKNEVAVVSVTAALVVKGNVCTMCTLKFACNTFFAPSTSTFSDF